MARRPSLSDAGVTRPSHTAAPAPAPTPGDAKRAPARQGKKAVAFWVDPAVSVQLRQLGLNTGKSVQDLMTEALADLFVKHRMPSLARLIEMVEREAAA